MKKVIRAFAARLYQYGIENARKPFEEVLK